jgi:hypothetical protein
MTQDSTTGCCSCFRKAPTRGLSLSEVRITENMEMWGMRSESEMVPAAYWKYEVLTRLKKLLGDSPKFTWINSILMKV